MYLYGFQTDVDCILTYSVEAGRDTRFSGIDKATKLLFTVGSIHPIPTTSHFIITWYIWTCHIGLTSLKQNEKVLLAGTKSSYAVFTSKTIS